MPCSLPDFDDTIELFLREARPATILDIGPGEGKYGRMARTVGGDARLIGIEIDETYVSRYGLRDVYDEIILGDAAELIAAPQRAFDAVIFGDCIEHMRKSAGTDLLHFLVYRCKAMLVKFPVQMVQNDWQGHAGEAHLSVWSQPDFDCFDHLWLESGMMRLAIIRGYLSHTIEWLPGTLMQKLGYESCAAWYDQQPQRWKLADAQTLRRQRLVGELSTIIGPDDRFVLADEMQSDLWPWAGARAIPFTEKGGQYWGMPADDDAAIAEIERQRQAGAQFLVFIAPTTWAVKHYPRMTRHLDENHRRALDNDLAVVFDLRP